MIRTRDLRDTSAMLYQLSYEATHWERGQIYWVHISREVWNDVKYILNNSYLNCPDFLRLFLSNCLNWKINWDYHSSFSFTAAVQIWIISYVLHFISLLTGDMNSINLTSLPMCGFIARLVEHCTGIAEVTVSNPVEALIFFRLLLSNYCLNWKINCDDHSSLSLMPMFAT